MTLKQIIEDTDTRAGRAFDLTIQALIVLSLISFTIETLPNLSQAAKYWLFLVEMITIAIFTIEYGCRILVADNRLKYIFSFYGLVDLSAILPFYIPAYISPRIDLRAVRILRFFRLFRIFKLLRYMKAMQRFKDAFLDIKEELLLYLMATGLMIFLSSVGIYFFEREAQPEAFGSIFHCMWWAMVTLTTVGYGDAIPITVGGRIFTIVVLLLGISVIAVPSGLLASALTKTRDK